MATVDKLCENWFQKFERKWILASSNFKSQTKVGSELTLLPFLTERK